MTYQSTAESEEGFMDIRSSFIANAQSAKLVQPTERTFDDPTRFAQATAVRRALPNQQVANASALQPATVSAVAIGPISLHQGGSLTRPASLAGDCRNGQQQGFKGLAIVHVGTGQLCTERNALGIGAKMMLTARFAAIRRVATRLEPPKTARTLLESTTARDQSIRSAACNRRSSSLWSFCQTPAFCQSRSRRQQVMPLPHPNSCGKSSQPIPVFSTKRIPVRAARLLRGLRPGYFCLRAFTGISGWMISHNESSINGFAIPRISPIRFEKYSHFVRRSYSKKALPSRAFNIASPKRPSGRRNHSTAKRPSAFSAPTPANIILMRIDLRWGAIQREGTSPHSSAQAAM